MGDAIFAGAAGYPRRAARPWVYWDERLSSFAADEWIAEAGPHAAGQDAVAAAIILRSFLDARRASGA